MTHLYPCRSAKSASGDEALTSLMRAIRMNEVTIELGTDICERLSNQGQKIDGVIKKLEVIDKKVNVCETDVAKMNSVMGLGFWHSVVKFFSSTAKVIDTVARADVKPKKSFFAKKKEPLALPKCSAGDQVNAALDIVDNQIKQLRGISLQINSELGYQNERLEVASNAASIAAHNLNHVFEEEEDLLPS